MDAHVESSTSDSVNHVVEIHRQKKDAPFSDIGPLKSNERRDLNCAVKEYLLIAGYRLTAMTFYEEVLATIDFAFFLILQGQFSFIYSCILPYSFSFWGLGDSAIGSKKVNLSLEKIIYLLYSANLHQPGLGDLTVL